MARNKSFRPDREPLRNTSTLQLNSDAVHGPISFFNPTQARFTAIQPEKPQVSDELETARGTPEGEGVPPSNVEFKWTSRDNRKGRHALVIPPEQHRDTQCRIPPPTSSTTQVLRGILRMLTYFPLWDISYLISVFLTFGSVVWIFNSFSILLPVRDSDLMSAKESQFTAGISPFMGTTAFTLGSMLSLLEGWNANRGGCFGWALDRLYDRDDPSSEQGSVTQVVARKEECVHHHQNHFNLVGKRSQRARRNLLNREAANGGTDSMPDEAKSWVWLPS